MRSTHEKGQGFVEYALLFALIALAVIFIMTLLGGSLNNLFANIV